MARNVSLDALDHLKILPKQWAAGTRLAVQGPRDRILYSVDEIKKALELFQKNSNLIPESRLEMYQRVMTELIDLGPFMDHVGTMTDTILEEKVNWQYGQLSNEDKIEVDTVLMNAANSIQSATESVQRFGESGRSSDIRLGTTVALIRAYQSLQSLSLDVRKRPFFSDQEILDKLLSLREAVARYDEAPDPRDETNIGASPNDIIRAQEIIDLSNFGNKEVLLNSYRNARSHLEHPVPGFDIELGRAVGYDVVNFDAQVLFLLEDRFNTERIKQSAIFLDSRPQGARMAQANFLRSYPLMYLGNLETYLNQTPGLPEALRQNAFSLLAALRDWLNQNQNTLGDPTQFQALQTHLQALWNALRDLKESTLTNQPLENQDTLNDHLSTLTAYRVLLNLPDGFSEARVLAEYLTERGGTPSNETWKFFPTFLPELPQDSQDPPIQNTRRIIQEDLSLRYLQAILQGPSGVAVRSLVFFTTQDGQRRLASGPYDGTIRIWNLDNPQAPPQVFQGPAGVAVSSLASFTTQDGQIRLASGSYDGTIRIWNLDNPQEPPQDLQGPTDVGVSSLAFFTTQDGQRRLASGSFDGDIHIWQIPSGARMADAETYWTSTAGLNELMAQLKAYRSPVPFLVLQNYVQGRGPISGIHSVIPKAIAFFVQSLPGNKREIVIGNILDFRNLLEKAQILESQLVALGIKDDDWGIVRSAITKALVEYNQDRARLEAAVDRWIQDEKKFNGLGLVAERVVLLPFAGAQPAAEKRLNTAFADTIKLIQSIPPIEPTEFQRLFDETFEAEKALGRKSSRAEITRAILGFVVAVYNAGTDGDLTTFARASMVSFRSSYAPALGDIGNLVLREMQRILESPRGQAEGEREKAKPAEAPPPLKRDYYEVLGVPRDTDIVTIKKAYRKLAMQYHPDRNAGDKEAESKFKEATKAVKVLRDPDKRQRYDRYGHAADPGAGAERPEDRIFSQGTREYKLMAIAILLAGGISPDWVVRSVVQSRENTYYTADFLQKMQSTLGVILGGPVSQDQLSASIQVYAKRSGRDIALDLRQAVQISGQNGKNYQNEMQTILSALQGARLAAEEKPELFEEVYDVSTPKEPLLSLDFFSKAIAAEEDPEDPRFLAARFFESLNEKESEAIAIQVDKYHTILKVVPNREDKTATIRFFDSRDYDPEKSKPFGTITLTRKTLDEARQANKAREAIVPARKEVEETTAIVLSAYAEYQRKKRAAENAIDSLLEQPALINQDLHLVRIIPLDLILGADPDPTVINLVRNEYNAAKDKIKKLGPVSFIFVSQNKSLEKAFNDLSDNISDIPKENVRFQYTVQSKMTEEEQGKLSGEFTALLRNLGFSENYLNLVAEQGFGVSVAESQPDRTSKDKHIIPILFFETTSSITARLKDPSKTPDRLQSYLLDSMGLKGQWSFVQENLSKLQTFDKDFKFYLKFSVKAVKIEIDLVLAFVKMAMKEVGSAA